MLNIVLVSPEIHQNTGNIARTCAATGARLHLVRPLGFEITDKALRRAGLDYWYLLDVSIHDSLEDFFRKEQPERFYLLSTKAPRRYCDAQFQDGDYLLFGRESAGLPEPLLEEHREALGISHIYSREELDRLHAVPEPVLAVEAAEGVAFSDGLEEEKREKATHGFGPGRKGCNCLFAVYGRGIRRGVELPSMSMRDVGPTVAGLMGISLPDAQGVDRSADFLA